MTSNCYIIDTSSLVKLNKDNPLDVFPTIWGKLKDLIDNDRLVAPKEVFNEINQNDDQLSEWVKTQKKMFKEPTPRQIELVQEILNKYPSLIKVDRKYDADPWVIALAIELTIQKRIISIKRIVVSEEKLRGERVRIPLVCDEYKIENMDLITMFRTEGWKF